MRRSLVLVIAAVVAPLGAQCTWSAVGMPISQGNTTLGYLKVFDADGPGGSAAGLYMCGVFNVTGGILNLARWDGVQWSTLGNAAPNGYVWEMAVHDEDGPGGSPPALFAVGGFDAMGSSSTPGIARWDGVGWSAVGNGLFGEARCAAVFDEDGPGGNPPVLFVGGTFSAGGMFLIARWDGTSFTPVGGGLGAGVGQCNALTVYDDGNGEALYATGAFSSAGGAAVRNVARWNGVQWSAVGVGLDALGSVGNVGITFDDGSGPAYYVGGYLSTVGGVRVNGIARWNGTTWSALGRGVSGSSIPSVHALRVFDDGTGPSLYAGGTFLMAGVLAANCIARWNAGAWLPLAEGLAFPGLVSGSVSGMEVFDDGSGPALYCQGLFQTAGAVSAVGVARWGCPGTGPSVWLTQPSGPGGGVFAISSNLVTGSEYHSVFSVEPCASLGSGPFLGLCASAGPSLQFLIDQVFLPLGPHLFHFEAKDTHHLWSVGSVPPVTIDGITFQITGTVIGPVSLARRFTIL